MRTLLLFVAVLLVLAAPVSAAGRGPDVAEIEGFAYDECENVFYWTATSEAIIYGYRIENPQAGWVSPFYQAANYGSTRPSSYALYGPDFCPTCKHFPSDYWLRVYYDTGFSTMEDVAARECHWVPPWSHKE